MGGAPYLGLKLGGGLIFQLSVLCTTKVLEVVQIVFDIKHRLVVKTTVQQCNLHPVEYVNQSHHILRLAKQWKIPITIPALGGHSF